MSETVKNTTYWFIYDWKKEQGRAVKTEPSSLKSNEFKAKIDIKTVVPEVDIPDLSMDFTVPEPMIESAVAEALDSRSFADWEKEAESIIAEQYDRIRSADEETAENIANGITIQTMRAARGRPSIDKVERYVRHNIDEIRDDEG